MHSHRWWNQKGDCDDLEDKPSCIVFCFVLLAAFVGESVMVSVLASDAKSFEFDVINDTITLYFHNDYR